MRYRLLRKEDVATVYRLGRAAFRKQTDYSWDWSAESVRQYLRRGHGFGLVCVDDGRLVGFLLVQQAYSSQKPNVSWATFAYVVPARRRQGIGSALLDRAAARLRRMGKRDLIADIYADNTGSIRFFTRRGFGVQERWLLLRRPL